MTNRRARCVLMSALFTFSPGTPAKAAGPEDLIRLSLTEVERRAQRESPGVRIAEAELVEARATRVGADIRMPSNPRLSLDARTGAARDVRGQHGFAASLEGLFEVGDVPGARVREAERRTEVAHADLEVARLHARIEARRAYVGVKLAELRIEQARQGLALAERLITAAEERGRAGAGTDIEGTSAAVERAERRAELDAGEAERMVEAARLRRVLQLRPEAELQLTTSITEPEPLPAPAELLRLARERRPELAAFASRSRLLAAADERLRKEAWPRLGAHAAIDASPASPMFGVLGLSIELPFFQRNQGPRAVVAAARQTSAIRHDLLEHEIEIGLGATVAAYEARRRELAALERDGLPAAQRRAELVEQGWRAGRFDVFKVTAAAQDLVRLRAKHAEVLERIWEERLVVDALTGGLAHVEK